MTNDTEENSNEACDAQKPNQTVKLSRSPGSDYEARDIEHHRYHKHQLVLTATGEVPVSRYPRRKSHDGDADQDFADAIHLGVYHIAEQLLAGILAALNPACWPDNPGPIPDNTEPRHRQQ